jgi:hypothetical protein
MISTLEIKEDTKTLDGSSSVFNTQELYPKYTCDGKNVNPPLFITQPFILILIQ